MGVETHLVHVVTGCMFSGKSTELRRLINREYEGGRPYQLFKSVLDNRYGAKEELTTHDGQTMPCQFIRSTNDLLTKLDDSPVIGIEEAQFLDKKIITVVNDLANAGRLVVVAGLNTDFRGLPFPFMDGQTMADLIAMANVVTMLSAKCKYMRSDGKLCGRDAFYTQRFIDGKPVSYFSPTIKVGGEESYQARCRQDHEVPDRP